MACCFPKLFGIEKRSRESIKLVDDAAAAVFYGDRNDDGGGGGGGIKKYSWDDIERLTENFLQVIGSGGFTNVFLARLSDAGGAAAVKIHVGSHRLSQVFEQELDILRRLSHDNIVKLIGYCDDRDEGVLVFEYLPNGTLQEKLHCSSKGPPLPWLNRMAIAFQVAQAMEYLHEKCTLHIVHGDIKASNILLDENLSCKLCDFGSAKMGFSSAVLPAPYKYQSPSPSRKTMMMGSLGYTDPHYLKTGIASTKNDVYSFGVILLELVTGKEAFCPEKGRLLTSMARSGGGGSILHDIADAEAAKVAELVDPRLAGAGDFDLEEARAVLSMSALCLHQSPMLRPSASQISTTFKHRISSISFLCSPLKNSTAT